MPKLRLPNKKDANSRIADNWRVSSSPESAGLDLYFLRAIAAAAENRRLTNLHSVVVTRHGRLVYEQYFTGLDYRLGTSLGDIRFESTTLHDVRSVTKSIVGLLYGIALSDRAVLAVDRPLLDGFPEYTELREDERRTGILVGHALTMTMGTEWDETLPYSDPRNDERRMYEAPDLCGFVLDRPLVTMPGERWRYNGGATALIARLIARGTGRPLIEYARERLFGPLGIEELQWMKDPAGEPMAAAGLRMRPRDLAKIGQLILNDGRWSGREIVPAAWVKESMTPRTDAEPSVRYGYFWWLSSSMIGEATIPWAAAAGNGGQRIWMLRDLDMVVVTTAGNYDRRDNGRTSLAVLNQFVLPALAAGPRE